MSPDDLPIRIAKRITVNADGCWLWGGARKASGYGVVNLGGRMVQAHRLAYHLLRDADEPVIRIDVNRQIDHLCNVRHCLNPLHLEIVTARQNINRKFLRTVGTERPLMDVIVQVLSANGPMTRQQIADAVGSSYLPASSLQRLEANGEVVRIGKVQRGRFVYAEAAA